MLTLRTHILTFLLCIFCVDFSASSCTLRGDIGEGINGSCTLGGGTVVVIDGFFTLGGGTGAALSGSTAFGIFVARWRSVAISWIALFVLSPSRRNDNVGDELFKIARISETAC